MNQFISYIIIIGFTLRNKDTYFYVKIKINAKNFKNSDFGEKLQLISDNKHIHTTERIQKNKTMKRCFWVNFIQDFS